MQLNGKLLFIGLLFLNCSAFAQGIGPSTNGGSPGGAAGGGLTGTYPNPTVATNANLTGDVTSVGNATTYGGIVPAAKGGAGTITGALKGSGAAGVVSQAACSDLSDSSTACVSQTAWAAFTPSPSCGTATFTVTSARFKTAGKTTNVEIDLTINSLGTCAGVLSFTLPNTAASAGSLVGPEVGVLNQIVGCRIQAASAATSCLMNGGTAYQANSRPVLSGSYENQ